MRREKGQQTRWPSEGSASSIGSRREAGRNVIMKFPAATWQGSSAAAMWHERVTEAAAVERVARSLCHVAAHDSLALAQQQRGMVEGGDKGQRQGETDGSHSEGSLAASAEKGGGSRSSGPVRDVRRRRAKYRGQRKKKQNSMEVRASMHMKASCPSFWTSDSATFCLHCIDCT